VPTKSFEFLDFDQKMTENWETRA